MALADHEERPPGMAGMQPEHALVPGMMSEQQMRQFTATGGTGFDRMFLQMMIARHQGAVTMSQTELAQGSNPAARSPPCRDRTGPNRRPVRAPHAGSCGRRVQWV
ncbi:MAG: DUF305 domain-containing protein [Pseudonocardiaceae bacterium]